MRLRLRSNERILSRKCPFDNESYQVHYRGTLASDGSEFDASYNRGSPLSFTVGKGQVIKGLGYSFHISASHDLRWPAQF